VFLAIEGENNLQKLLKLALLVIVALPGSTSLLSAMAQSERLRFDTPTEVNGIEVVCTGIGREVRENPAWNEYALKVEVAGEQSQFLGNVEIAVQRDGESVIDLVCGGPWILAQLEAGAYNVTATFEGTSRSGAISIAPNEQSRLVIQIPVAAGAVSEERMNSPN
jgi:hypothetical protein